MIAASVSVAVEQPTQSHTLSGLPVDHRSKIIALLRSNADRTTLHAALKDAGIQVGERLRLLNLLAPTERLLPRCYFCTQKWERFDWNTHTSTKNNNLELTMFKQLLPSDCEIVLFEPTNAAIAGLEPHAGGVILNISSNAITYDNACRAVAACRSLILHTSDEWGQSLEFLWPRRPLHALPPAVPSHIISWIRRSPDQIPRDRIQLGVDECRVAPSWYGQQLEAAARVGLLW